MANFNIVHFTRPAEPDYVWQIFFDLASNDLLPPSLHRRTFIRASSFLDMQRRDLRDLRFDSHPRHKLYLLTTLSQLTGDLAPWQFRNWERGRTIDHWSQEHYCPLWVGWKCLMISGFDMSTADFIFKVLSAWDDNPALRERISAHRRVGRPRALENMTIPDPEGNVADLSSPNGGILLADQEHGAAFMRSMNTLNQQLHGIVPPRQRWDRYERPRPEPPQPLPTVYQPLFPSGGRDFDPQSLLGPDYGRVILRFAKDRGCPLIVSWMCLMISRFDHHSAEYFYDIFYGSIYRT